MVTDPAELLTSVREYCHVLQRNLNHHLPVSSSLWLLEQIVALGSDQLACQQNLNILSDLFPSLRALSAAVRTVEGCQFIAEYLGDHVASNIAAFWGQEWVCG